MYAQTCSGTYVYYSPRLKISGGLPTSVRRCLNSLGVVESVVLAGDSLRVRTAEAGVHGPCKYPDRRDGADRARGRP